MNIKTLYEMIVVVQHCYELSCFFLLLFTNKYLHWQILSKVTFKVHILSVIGFLGSRTHELGVASTMLYFLSYLLLIINC